MKHKKTKTAKRLLAALCAALTCLTACACAVTEIAPVKPTEAPIIAPVQNAANIKIHAYDISEPLKYRGNMYVFGDVGARYPIFYGHEAGLEISNLTYAAVVDFVEKNSEKTTSMDFRVTYNNRGVLSFAVYAYSKSDDSPFEVLPFTFDLRSGELLTLDGLFSSSQIGWKAEMATIITQMAEDRSMLLLSSIEPLSTKTAFYITSNSICVVYGVYEISNYAEGMPHFSVTFDKVTEYLDNSGIIARIALDY